MPTLVILENVRAIMRKRSCHTDGDESPAQHIMNEFRAMGYEGGVKVLNTREYGLPQRRSRCYFVFVHVGKEVESGYDLQPDNLAANAFLVAKTLKCTPMPLGDFLSECKPEPSKHRETPKTWLPKHEAYMHAHGITHKDIDNMMKSVEFKRQPKQGRHERIIHMTAVHYVRMQKNGMNPYTTPMVMQVDQACSRMPRAIGECPCVTPKGKYWMTNAGYLISEYDKLALQGVTSKIQKAKGLDLLAPKLVGDLAGNAFSLPVCNAVLLGALASHANRHG